MPDDPFTGELLSQLVAGRTYPDDPSAHGSVDWVQTHLSHVFLTGERVYKFRKAVDLGFVCFTSRDERNADCLREVAFPAGVHSVGYPLAGLPGAKPGRYPPGTGAGPLERTSSHPGGLRYFVAEGGSPRRQHLARPWR